MSNRILSRWWAAPRRASEVIMNRRVSFLELFYDLVFVAFLSRIAHGFGHHMTLEGMWAFITLLLIGWWSWSNGTLYHELHGNDDIRSRVFTFLQMFFVMLMGIFSHHAFGEGAAAFIGSFIGLLLVNTYLWWMTGVTDEDHRPMSRIYTSVFLIIIILLGMTVIREDFTNYYVWPLIVLGGEFLAFGLIYAHARTGKIDQDYVENFRITHSLQERYALFTIIVIGEIILSIVSGLIVDHHYILHTIGVLAFGMSMAMAIWWLYFDFIAESKITKNWIMNYAWMYMHFPLTLGISVLGVVVIRMTEIHGHGLMFNDRLSLVLPISLVFLSMSVLHALAKEESSHPNLYRWFLIEGALIWLLMAFEGHLYIVLGSILVLLLLPIVAFVKSDVKAALKEQNHINEE